MTAPKNPSDTPTTGDAAEDRVIDLLRGRHRIDVGLDEAQSVELTRIAARRAAEREIESIDAAAAERVRQRIQTRTQRLPAGIPSPKARAPRSGWGFAMAAGLSGLVLGMLLQTQIAPFGPISSRESASQLVMTVGDIERGNIQSNPVIVAVNDPVAASSHLVEQLILDHTSFQLFSNRDATEQRVIFSLSYPISEKLKAILLHIHAPEVGEQIEVTFRRKG